VRIGGAAVGLYFLLPPVRLSVAVTALVSAALIASANYLTFKDARFCKRCGAAVRWPSSFRGLLAVVFRRPLHGIDYAYCPSCSTLIDPAQVVATPGIMDLSDPESFANNQPLLKLLAYMTLLAIRDRASEVRFEPGEEALSVTCKIDGHFYELIPPPLHLWRPMSQTIEALAAIDFDKDDVRQEGRIRVLSEGRTIETIVGTEPTRFGKLIVARFVWTIETARAS
jgi:hypothetical protein